MRSTHYLTLMLGLLQITLSSAQQQQKEAKCYSPNGTELDSSYTPCTPKSGFQHSGCCATNRTTGSPDICLDSGLCMQTHAEFMGTIWHSGCTDPQSKHEGCANMCASTNPNKNQPSSWNIKTCSPGLYCCEDPTSPTQNCCADTTIPKISTSLGVLQLAPRPNTLASTTKSPTVNASAPSPSTSTSLSPPSPPSALFAASNTTPPQNQPNPTLRTLCKSERQTASQKTAVRIGSIVGALLGAVVVGLLILVGWTHGREKRQRLLKEHYEEQVQGYRRVRVVYGRGEKEGEEVVVSEVTGNAAEKGVRR